MKWMVIVLLLFSNFCSAQNLAEWTRQKKTQIEYLSQQVIANKVYIELVQKGYSVAKNGLRVIADIKDGEFSLHKNYFASLKAVNPKIKSYAKVAAIVDLQSKIVRQSKLIEMDQLTREEVTYCSKVFDNIKLECRQELDELIMLLNDGRFLMRDDERIHRLDQLYESMEDKYVFCQSFADDLKVLSIQRSTEQAEIKHSKVINKMK